MTPGAGRGVATAMGLYDMLQGLNSRRQYDRRQQQVFDSQQGATRRLQDEIREYRRSQPADPIGAQGPNYSPVHQNLDIAESLAAVDPLRAGELFYEQVNRKPQAPPITAQAVMNQELPEGTELEAEVPGVGKIKRKGQSPPKLKISEFDDAGTGFRTIVGTDEATGSEQWRRQLGKFSQPSNIITERTQMGQDAIISFIDKGNGSVIRRLKLPNEKQAQDEAMQHFRDNLALVVNGQQPAKGSRAEGLTADQAKAILETLKASDPFGAMLANMMGGGAAPSAAPKQTPAPDPLGIR
jgi:hypothetical protein